jgi:hypothetical protein
MIIDRSISCVRLYLFVTLIGTITLPRNKEDSSELLARRIQLETRKYLDGRYSQSLPSRFRLLRQSMLLIFSSSSSFHHLLLFIIFFFSSSSSFHHLLLFIIFFFSLSSSFHYHLLFTIIFFLLSSLRFSLKVEA